MFLSSWLRNRTTTPRANRAAALRQRPARFRPGLEMLEDRWVPSTLTVTNTLDSGAGSLRADIAAATSGDTIAFNIPKSDPGYNATTGVWTITLTSGELDITKNLTITGPGADELTISGNHASAVFVVQLSGKTKPHQPQPQLSLSGMTISNGIGSGGGIHNSGTVTVNGCTLTGNSTGDAGEGGAIENFGTLTVSASVLSNNSASYGGGIWNDGTATLTATTLSGNSVSYTHGAADGGGIYNTGVGTLTLNGCTLSGNSARMGGGIFNGGTTANATLNLSRCTLTDNSATYAGGGIYIAYDTTATVSGSVVGPATVGGTALPGNSAPQGGGIYVDSTGTLTVTNSSTITGNTAPAGSGPDVYNLGTLYLDSTSSIGILDGNPAKPI
jgi:hypothetical protein